MYPSGINFGWIFSASHCSNSEKLCSFLTQTHQQQQQQLCGELSRMGRKWFLEPVQSHQSVWSDRLFTLCKYLPTWHQTDSWVKQPVVVRLQTHSVQFTVKVNDLLMKKKYGGQNLTYLQVNAHMKINKDRLNKRPLMIQEAARFIIIYRGTKQNPEHSDNLKISAEDKQHQHPLALTHSV